MKLAFIAPINALKEISSKGEIEYCLAPYLKYPKYKKYFIEQIKKKKYIILDDSIAENGGVLKPRELVDLAININASEIICPDVIGNKLKTDVLRENFLDEYYEKLKVRNIKIQCVIQGKTWAEYIASYLTLLSDDRVDVIGVPFRMFYAKFKGMTKEQNNMWNRLLFLNYICCQKPIHMLGCNIPLELVLVTQKGCSIYCNIRSCDSKLMARYGMSKKLFSTDDETKPEKKFEITDNMTKAQIEWAVKNINYLKRELKGG